MVFGNLTEYAESRTGMIVDEEETLRIFKGGEMSVVVPSPLVKIVLESVHGTRITGHYRKKRTLARLRGKYWWKSWKKDV